MSRALSLLVTLGLLAGACDSPAEPTATSPQAGPSKPAKAEPTDAPATEPIVDEPDPKPTAPPATPPATEADDGEWQRGTIVALPGDMHAIHADDDSVTICFPDLPVELQKEGLAVLYQGDLEDPIPRDRRMCRIATNLAIKPAEASAP
jgi:hypothetical protein